LRSFSTAWFPRIVFAGPQFGLQKDALFCDAYLFVLPSTIEGMAIVLLEAMSFGAGCLCSDIPESIEVVKHSPGGPVAARFRTDDIDDLARQLDSLLNTASSCRGSGSWHETMWPTASTGMRSRSSMKTLIEG
jgi:glycosyltransferase involved in cell wall biosynthesis